MLANALNAIETPLRSMSVTLVPGGSIARVVAMVVTEPPMDMHMQTDLSRHFLLALHTELLDVVRRAGLRRLAMPTLCTGGIGMPPDLVAEAIVCSWINDLHNQSSAGPALRPHSMLRSRARRVHDGFERRRPIAALLRARRRCIAARGRGCRGALLRP